MQNFLHWLAHEVLKEAEVKNVGLCPLAFRTQQNQVGCVVYAHLPVPTKSFSEYEPHMRRNRVNLITRIIQHQASNEGAEDAKVQQEELLLAVGGRI